MLRRMWAWEPADARDPARAAAFQASITRPAAYFAFLPAIWIIFAGNPDAV